MTNHQTKFEDSRPHRSPVIYWKPLNYRPTDRQADRLTCA